MISLLLTAAVGLIPLAAFADSQPEPKTLRQAAGPGFSLGVAIAAHNLDDPRYREHVVSQFNSLTAENEMKPSSMLRAPGEYDFTAADRFMAFAEEHGMEVIGHTLVWHAQAPGFLFQDAEGKPLPREVALKNMRDHIFTVMGRYKGRVKGWDVVNEAVADSGGLRDTPARRAIGDDYLVKAFEFAAQADPEAELYYNDYNIELDYKRPSGLALVKSLRDAGVRLDAVGIQGHYMTSTSMDEVKRGIQAYIDEGFKVVITELDVDPLPRRGSGGADVTAAEREGLNPYVNGLPDEQQKRLAEFYGEFFDFALARPQITRITFWGASDAHTWLNNFPVRGRTNHPLLFDRSLAPKPAFHRVLESFRKAGFPRTKPLENLTWVAGAEVVPPPKDPRRPVVAIKDPTVVRHEGLWHLFATVARSSGWQMVYMNFPTWEGAAKAEPRFMDEANPGLRGYHCAPQVFWFEPHGLWYLIYQSQHPQFSTTKTISDPSSWSAPKSFFAEKPAGAPDLWLDYFIICDETHAYLFFTGDDGKLYRSRTALADFPNGMSPPVIVLSEENRFHLFEGSAHYRMKDGGYLTIIEAIGPTGIRYYRSWTAERLDGKWTPLADTWEKPFAGVANVRFAPGVEPWTEDISHGELIREGFDQTMTIDPNNLQLLFQGRVKSSNGMEYLLLPYRLGLLKPAGR
ncbi:MAG: endo-1,4-beta-xylanase [Fimbriimonadaceae bacterium]|nr:endo-1,4-beta-xylanase [Fimbriimonadaceae bacterium]